MRTVQWELRVAAKGLGLGQEVHRLAGAVGNKPQRSANALFAISAALLPQVRNLLLLALFLKQQALGLV